jgi:asparagine synthase (glutamine-hydrolysing)
MCGIAGIAPLNSEKDKIDIIKIINKIKHRGPDQEIIFSNGLGIFGFVRLKIIDMSSKSNQPFLSKNKKIQVIYNGEIYNFKQLKKYFSSNIFRSNGDGEVLLHLYEKFGINFLKKIKGMFSICIIDENINKIFLIRDRFGIKPLYYYINDDLNKIYFCSEINSISELLGNKNKINSSEAFKFFQQGLVNSNEETWFKNIKQVKASHYIEYSKNSIKERKYYYIENSVDEENESKSFKACILDFKTKLQESFIEHNQFDVKAGIHLSGGVDSAVLAAMSNYNKKNYNSYTFDFENKQYSELDFAKIISESANLKNYSSILTENNLSNYLLKVIEREHEPFSSLRVLSQHNLYDTFKNDCKVIIDGSGGDEVGAGYSYHMIPWYLDVQKSFKKEKNKKRFCKYIDLVKNNTINTNQFIKGAFSYFRNPGSATIDGSIYGNNKLFNKDFLKIDKHLNFNKPFKSHLRNAQYADLFYLKLPRSLKYADRASMYNSIETRVPFLDHEVVESSLQIPSKFKFLNGQQRIIMKYPFRNYVNKKTLYLNKRTIADPQSDWLKGPLKNLILDTFNSKSFNSSGFFIKDEVIKYYNNFIKYPLHFNSFLLFQILISEIWYKDILKKKLILNPI